MPRTLYLSDGSDHSRVAAQYVAWWHERQPGEVLAVYATDPRQFETPAVADVSGSLGVQPFGDVTEKFREIENDKAARVSDLAKTDLAAKPGILSLTFDHRTETLADCLEDLEKGTDLIFLGKRGENAELVQALLGSNLERVIRATHKPCFVTNRAFRSPKRFLIAYDNGVVSQRAIRWAAAQPALKGLECHLAVVAAKGQEDAAAESLKTGEAIAHESGLKPVCQMLSGVLEDTLSRYTEENAVDLLLMGAYSHSRLRNMLLGSTTTAMMRKCRVPVICFR